jgi:hypothetical protein
MIPIDIIALINNIIITFYLYLFYNKKNKHKNISSLKQCIVEAWEGELNRTQAVIAHLIENEARGELILVDKAKALIELSKKSSSSE